MVIATEFDVPDGGTLPVPVQPVLMCCVVVPSGTMAGVERRIFVPNAYMLLPTGGVGEPNADAIVSDSEDGIIWKSLTLILQKFVSTTDSTLIRA